MAAAKQPKADANGLALRKFVYREPVIEAGLANSFTIGSQLVGGEITGFVTEITAEAEGVVVAVKSDPDNPKSPMRYLFFTPAGYGILEDE